MRIDVHAHYWTSDYLDRATYVQNRSRMGRRSQSRFLPRREVAPAVAVAHLVR